VHDFSFFFFKKKKKKNLVLFIIYCLKNIKRINKQGHYFGKGDIQTTWLPNKKKKENYMGTRTNKRKLRCAIGKIERSSGLSLQYLMGKISCRTGTDTALPLPRLHCTTAIIASLQAIQFIVILSYRSENPHVIR
jgi:hypothetical protein